MEQAKLPKDPMTAYESGIIAENSHLGHIATANFQYYGIINSGNPKIVSGPTWQIKKVTRNSEKWHF